MFKKTFLFLFSLLLTLNVGSLASANEDLMETTHVEAKQELADKYIHLRKNLSEKELEQRTLDVQRELNVIASDMAAGKKTEKEAKLELEKMDVYILETPEYTDITPFSSGSDITMNAVMITYDANTSRWTVTGGGFWKNKNWYNDRPGGVWVGGQTKNVGGLDSVGVTLYNTSGSYSGVSVVSSLGYVTDHNGWNDWLYNPSHGDGRNGIAFDFQDKMRLSSSCTSCSKEDFTYFGTGFSASVTYNSKFSNYHGNARTFYAHTWNTTTINGIGFSGGSGSYGVTINWSSTSNKFSIFNGSDKSF